MKNSRRVLNFINYEVPQKLENIENLTMKKLKSIDRHKKKFFSRENSIKGRKAISSPVLLILIKLST